MARWHISSKAGTSYGIWEGETKAEALAALHREGGYECAADGDRIQFAEPDDERICGQPEAWTIEPAQAITVREYWERYAEPGADEVVVEGSLYTIYRHNGGLSVCSPRTSGKELGGRDESNLSLDEACPELE